MVTNPDKRSSVALNQALELARGDLPREFESWDEVPAALVPENLVLLRSSKASEGQGGALGEAEALRRGNTVGIRDQVMDLVAEQGLKVSRAVDNLLPTPAVAHLRNHDEPIDGYLERRQDFLDGKTKGMPGASLGVAVRMQQEGIELLPTPNTMEHREIKTTEQIAELKERSPGGYRNLREEVIHHLPTPTTRDFKDGSEPHEREGIVQTDTVARAIFNSGEVKMLPTPQVDDSKNTGHNQDRRPTLASEVWETERSTAWGKFAPAIERWEQTLGRPAPAPTKPDGKDGTHRLSSAFTEWMMGLPEGWITDCGLSRNEELKACGNGVVPQQAELALRILLEGIDLPTEKKEKE